MNRDILFKAKRLDNGEWVEGLLWKKKYQSNKWFISCFPDKDDNEEVYVIDINTLCQYTGLTDKNGNKIWENDVVKYHFGNNVAVIRFGEYQSPFDSTKTKHIGFYVDWKRGCLRKDLGYWTNMIEPIIVGNIFDNTELLEAVE